MTRYILSIVLILSCITFSVKESAAYTQSEEFTTAPYFLLIDHNTGTVLAEKNADQKIAPSSMSKLMTLYVIFFYLQNGKIKLSDMAPVSEKAWKMEGSKMFLDVNSFVSVEDLLRGIIVQSGNDACVAIAEWIAGDESSFVIQMNSMAKKMDLNDSQFKNATGLPEDGHFMTSKDLTTLASRIIEDFPEYYHYFSEKEFTFNKIKQGNRNTLLGKNGVDGLKTGHADVAGYGLAFSAKQGDRRLIGVVNGLRSAKERGVEATKLLLFGLNGFENIVLFDTSTEILHVPVWHGSSDSIGLVLEEKLEIVIPKILNRDQIVIKAVYDKPILAPVYKGQKLGVLRVFVTDELIKEIPLLASRDLSVGNIFIRLKQSIISFWRDI